MKRVVVIGGGHGMSTILKGIKNIKRINRSAIVTVADDGGSTGRLRDLYNIPAVGDIRNVLLSMAEDEDNLDRLLDYRFKGEGTSDVVGHSLGNLVLAALIEMNDNSLTTAIRELGKLLKVKGRVYPASEEVLTLFVEYDDGTIGKGEANIPSANKRIERAYYDHSVKANKEAVRAIEKADLIIYGIGSLYTSILPVVVIPEINEALINSKAKKVYFANCMTQRGETYNYDLKDHVDALNKHGVSVDLVVKHNNVIPGDILQRYIEEDSIEVINNNNLKQEVIERDLLDFSKNNVRHSPNKIKKVVEELLRD